MLYAKRNESGSRNQVSCLKQDSEMGDFWLKQGRGLKAPAAHLYQNFSLSTPPPLPRVGSFLYELINYGSWLVKLTKILF